MSLKKLDSIRADIASKRFDLAELQRLPLHPVETEQRIDDLIDAWAGQVDVSWLGRQLVDPREIDPDDDLLGTAMAGSKVKTTALFAMLAPEALRSVMIESAMSQASLASPTLAERLARQRTLEKELHDLEVQEEQTIVALEDQHVEVFRRPDADPAIVLNFNGA